MDSEADVITYDRDHLPDGEWADYRKTATTRMTPITGPLRIVTVSGPHDLPDGWSGYLAVDVAGHPYPVDLSVAEGSYQRVDS
ncbi:MAG: hypothetical protein ACT4NY_09105 [Pseudonocardiales bacterium]